METRNLFEALYNYYNSNVGKMPKYGLSNNVAIKYIVVIDRDGKFVRFAPPNMVVNEKGKETVKCYDNVPFDVKVTRGVKAHLLYGNAKYFLPAREDGTSEAHDAFIREIRNAMALADDKPEFEAVLKFYESGEVEKLIADQQFVELMEAARKSKDEAIAKAKDDKKRRKEENKALFEYIEGSFTFQFQGDMDIVIKNGKHMDAFMKWYAGQQDDTDDESEKKKDRQCLYGIDSITGKYGKLVNVFPSKSMQATLVGFNNESSWSHGYERMGNCPMSSDTAFKVYSAFEYLCNDRRHNLFIGNTDADNTLVFWSSTNSDCITNDDVENDMFAEFDRLLGKVESDEPEGKEDAGAEKANNEKVKSLFKGTEKYIDERNSTYYVLSIVRPSKGVIFVRSFDSGKVGDLYDNLEKYQSDFATGNGFFLAPWQVMDACYRRNGDGDKVKNEESSKKHINMKRELLMNAIFGGRYSTPLLAEIIERIYKECGIEYATGRNKKPNRRGRIACLNAFASQIAGIPEMDGYKFDISLDSLPYQTGSFYGVCEAIRQKYNALRGKRDENKPWRIETTEFRKGLQNQTSEFIIDKLKRNALVLAKELADRERLVGRYEKKQFWTTVTKENGVVVRKGEWKMSHSKLGAIDFALIRMDKLKDKAKSVWSVEDKAMFLIGFYRMYKSLMYEKTEK